MKVKIKLTGLLAASVGFKEKIIELPEGSTIADTMIFLKLPVSGTWTRSSINGKLKNKSYVLKEDDELLFFPVGGGG